MSSNSFFIIFFSYLNISKYSSVKYHQNKKERLQKKADERYQSLSKDEKEKKQQYGHERCNNLLEDEKQKYRKSIEKKRLTVIIKTIILRNNDLESSFGEAILKL